MSAENIIPIAKAMQERKEELEKQGKDPKEHDWSEFDDAIRDVVEKANEMFQEEGVDLKVVFGNDENRRKLLEIPTLEERIEVMEKLRIRAGMTRKEFGRFFNFLSREKDISETEKTELAKAFYTWANFVEYYDRLKTPEQKTLSEILK